MSNLDLSNASTTNMKTDVPDFTVSSKVIDEATTKETIYDNPNWSINLGYYLQIPELKKAIDALAMWTTGRSYSCDARTQAILEHITGWGEDTIDSIWWNMIITKKVNGDAYAEIIRDPDTNILINLKPLNPSSIKIIINRKGLIDRYEEWRSNQEKRDIKIKDMFHICNDRIANQMHGTSVIEACKFVIDARNEAMADKRRMMHRSMIRVLYVDSDDIATYNSLKTQWADAIKNGEVLILPKDNVEFPNIPQISTAEHSEWIQYLENFFYQAVGVPKIILGGSQEFTEASSKIGYLTFEQPYISEQRQLEQDIWNQLQIRIAFERPVSLSAAMQSSEAANTGQVSLSQPTEVGIQNAD